MGFLTERLRGGVSRIIAHVFVIGSSVSRFSKSQDPQFQTTFTSFVLVLSIVIAIFVKSLPYERIRGNLEPTVLFKGLPPSIFHGLVIFDIFSFTAAFCSLMMGCESKIGIIFSLCSYMAFGSALAILAGVLFLNFWI